MLANPKYRRLNADELQALESEFVSFLVINGIPAEDWVKIVKTQPEKAEEYIVYFSDFVLESTLEKVKFIECRAEKFIKVFQCLPTALVMVGLECNNKLANFTDGNFLKKATTHPPKRLKTYTATKKYTKQRELELFELLCQGGVITDDKLFKAICLGL